MKNSFSKNVVNTKSKVVNTRLTTRLFTKVNSGTTVPKFHPKRAEQSN